MRKTLCRAKWDPRLENQTEIVIEDREVGVSAYNGKDNDRLSSTIYWIKKTYRRSIPTLRESPNEWSPSNHTVIDIPGNKVTSTMSFKSIASGRVAMTTLTLKSNPTRWRNAIRALPKLDRRLNIEIRGHHVHKQ